MRTRRLANAVLEEKVEQRRERRIKKTGGDTCGSTAVTINKRAIMEGHDGEATMTRGCSNEGCGGEEIERIEHGQRHHVTKGDDDSSVIKENWDGDTRVIAREVLINHASLGTPRGRFEEHSSKFSLS